MKMFKLLPICLLLALLGPACVLRAQTSQELQVPMSTSGQYTTPAAGSPGMQSTSPYMNGFSNPNGSVSTEASVRAMYSTTYDDNSVTTGRTKRRLGGYGDEEGDAGDDKDDIEQPGDTIPVGNGLWLLLAAVAGYCVYLLRKLRHEDEEMKD